MPRTRKFLHIDRRSVLNQNPSLRGESAFDAAPGCRMEFSISLAGSKLAKILRTVFAMLAPLGLLILFVTTKATGQSHIFAYAASNESVSVIDTTTNTVTATIDTGNVFYSSGYGVAISPDGSHAYVTKYACFYCGALLVIDTATNRLMTSIHGFGRPVAVAVTPDGSRAYVANNLGAAASVVDTTTNTVIATVSVGSHADDVAITPDGSHAYVTSYYNHWVSVIDTATNTVTATINIPNPTYGVAITPDGSRAYVALNSNSVSVIDTATNKVTATIGGFSGPNGVAITPDGSRVYVTNSKSDSEFSSVSVIDTATNTVTGAISVLGYTSAVAITPDGLHAYVSCGGSVCVIDTITNTVADTISAGANGIAISPVPITPILPADLQLQGIAAPSPVPSHSFYTYTFNITNNGPGPSAWPRLVAHVPYGATFHSYSISAPGYCVTPAVGTRGDVTCRYTGTQPVGTTWTVTLNVWAWAPPGTVITQTAGAWAATHDPKTSNNVVTITTDMQ